MGTDWTVWIEVKDNGTWKCEGQDWHPEKEYDLIFNPIQQRNYDKFAVLANVRNGYGFAQEKTGSGFKFITEFRGLPVDVTKKVADQCEHDEWGSWGPGYVTLKEILDFDWQQTTTKTAVISSRQWLAWKKEGAEGLSSWGGSVSGGNTRMVSNEEMDHLVKEEKTEGELSYYSQIDWEWTYERCCQAFYSYCQEVLAKWVTDPTNLRLVFWFDS